YEKEEVSSFLTRFANAVSASDEEGIRRLFNEILPEAAVGLPEFPVAKAAAADEKYFTPSANLGLAEK
ncbi:MAG TPA: hypothetical protein VJL58_00800, partial [Pyrinomonadaceae bacterium]|nr:hypothetical protein [Pyrinomonadaceae bacterium]